MNNENAQQKGNSSATLFEKDFHFKGKDCVKHIQRIGANTVAQKNVKSN